MTLGFRHVQKLNEPEFFWNDAGYVNVEDNTFRVSSNTTEKNLVKFGYGQLLDLKLGEEYLGLNEKGSLRFGVQNGFTIHPEFNPREGNGQSGNAVLGVVISSKHCVFGPNLLDELEEYENGISDGICEKPKHAMKIVRDGESKLWIF